MSQLILRHKDILPGDATYHLVRSTLSTARPKALHAQTFHELIWVQNGHVRHHLRDTVQELSEGDLVFVRPTDHHALQGRGSDPMIVSLCLHPTLVRRLGNRHDFTRFFWSGAPHPEIHHRDIRALSALNKAAMRLDRAPRTTLEAEAFLLPLLAELSDARMALPDDAPLWLRDALHHAQDPEIFRQGAAGFVRLCGRAHPHVSRVTRQFTGQTPSALLNDLRMDYAARRLTGTRDALADIAAEVGLPNLSHFHKLFRARHGLTPFRYRKQHQHDVISPETDD